MDYKSRRYGKPIGSHLGKPIYESIEDNELKYVFDRLAEGDTDGYPLDQLEANELLLNPGLIYKKVG